MISAIHLSHQPDSTGVLSPHGLISKKDYPGLFDIKEIVLVEFKNKSINML